MRTTVLLADDSGVVRKAISQLLNGDPEIEVLAEASNFSQAMKLTTELRPQIVVLDLHMCDDDNVTPSQVKSGLEGTHLVAISLSNDQEARAIADGFGAVTLIDKMNLFHELIPAIKLYGKKQDRN
jgi:two-component system chemotaxis response regulator CheB